MGITIEQWRVLEEISTDHFIPSMFARSRDSSAAAVSKILRQLLDGVLVLGRDWAGRPQEPALQADGEGKQSAGPAARVGPGGDRGDLERDFRATSWPHSACSRPNCPIGSNVIRAGKVRGGRRRSDESEFRNKAIMPPTRRELKRDGRKDPVRENLGRARGPRKAA